MFTKIILIVLLSIEQIRCGYVVSTMSTKIADNCFFNRTWLDDPSDDYCSVIAGINQQREPTKVERLLRSLYQRLSLQDEEDRREMSQCFINDTKSIDNNCQQWDTLLAKNCSNWIPSTKQEERNYQYLKQLIDDIDLSQICLYVLIFCFGYEILNFCFVNIRYTLEWVADYGHRCNIVTGKRSAQNDRDRQQQMVFNELNQRDNRDRKWMEFCFYRSVKQMNKTPQSSIGNNHNNIYNLETCESLKNGTIQWRTITNARRNRLLQLLDNLSEQWNYCVKPINQKKESCQEILLTSN